ncbi:hypothetical protein L3X38_008938 [Prunus dulcis]|uniref:Uncharacterized protein n=1 Tax=Prunus dulcis TaxID=3755 RepID=A0AAD5F7L2_PRUDU|nr:hypothetical protein L3X38_008938 [Prunus dulcis]
MEGCTNLTAEFRNNILQGWTSSGYGGIYLNGIYDIPEWFEIVNDVDNIVFFEVPQTIMGRDFKGLTICFVYSKFSISWYYQSQIGIIVRNLTKQTALHTRMASGSVKTRSKPEDSYLWQGQLSNDVLHLQGGDQVSILAGVDDTFVPNQTSVIHEQLAVETYLDFFWGTDNELGRSHDASAPGDQMSAIVEELSAIVEESAVEDDPFGRGG